MTDENKVASLAGIDRGVAEWCGQNIAGLFTRYGEPFYAIILTPYGDEESDLYRIREACTSGNLMFPSAVLQRRGLEFFTHEAPQKARSLYTAYSQNVESTIDLPITGEDDLPKNWREIPAPIRTQFNFRPVKIDYQIRIYFTNFSQASLFTERYCIWYEAQDLFKYNVGNAEIDAVATGSIIPPYPDGMIDTKPKSDEEEQGPISKVVLDLIVYANVFDVPRDPKLIYQATMRLIDWQGNLMDTITVPEK